MTQRLKRIADVKTLINLNRLRTAVVLCGGEGLRLRPMTLGLPKAMVQISGKPLLEWIINWLQENGIEQVVLGVAYRKEKIIKHFRDGRDYNIDISYSIHTVQGGTAEGFKLAINRFVKDDSFLAMNGDEMTDIQINKLKGFHDRQGGIATIAVGPLRSPYGIVDLSRENVVGFREKATISDHYVSIGIYVFEKEVLHFLPRTGNIEETVFPLLAQKRKLMAYRHHGFWATVNTPKDLADVEKLLGKVQKH